MSRYDITPRHPEHTVSVGWDNPLQTFFVHVRPLNNDEDEPVDIMWRGTSIGEIKRINDLVKVVMPYANISNDLALALEQDRVNALDRGPTRLQRSNLNILASFINAGDRSNDD